MTLTEIAPLLTQYRAALDAQMTMLRQLLALAARGREQAAQPDHLAGLTDIVDQRERLMAALVSLESDVQPLRQQLAEARDQLAHLAEFRDVMALHRQAVALVEEVVRTDDQSRASLRAAELTRRAVAESLDKSESTLAGYRRVVMPAVAAPALVNRRG